MMTGGDKRRWKRLEASKLKGEIFRLERERDGLRAAIVAGMGITDPIRRRMTVEARKGRYVHVDRQIATARARLASLRRELGE